MNDFDERVDRIAKACSKDVVGALLWYDPSGGMWLAPLGSPPPDPDRPMPPSWMAIERKRDGEVLM